MRRCGWAGGSDSAAFCNNAAALTTGWRSKRETRKASTTIAAAAQAHIGVQDRRGSSSSDHARGGAGAYLRNTSRSYLAYNVSAAVKLSRRSRHSEHTRACSRICAAALSFNSPSRSWSSASSPGCRASVCIGHLPELFDRPLEELARCGDSNAHHAGDLAVAQSANAEMETSALLRREQLDGVLERAGTLGLGELPLRCCFGRNASFEDVVERYCAFHSGPQIEPMIVRDPKDPGALVFNGLSFLQRAVITQKYFLRGVLRFLRIEPERQQIAVHVVAGVYECALDRFVDRHCVAGR